MNVGHEVVIVGSGLAGSTLVDTLRKKNPTTPISYWWGLNWL